MFIIFAWLKTTISIILVVALFGCGCVLPPTKPITDITIYEKNEDKNIGKEINSVVKLDREKAYIKNNPSIKPTKVTDNLDGTLSYDSWVKGKCRVIRTVEKNTLIIQSWRYSEYRDDCAVVVTPAYDQSCGSAW